MDVLDNNIERIKEIDGIGEKKFNIIYESYLEQHDLKDIMIYFQGFGITHGQCLKIYKRFGPNAKDSEGPLYSLQRNKGNRFCYGG
jgi:exodeoxyribonuclease V alpha subunit